MQAVQTGLFDDCAPERVAGTGLPQAPAAWSQIALAQLFAKRETARKALDAAELEAVAGAAWAWAQAREAAAGAALLASQAERALFGQHCTADKLGAALAILHRHRLDPADIPLSTSAADARPKRRERESGA